MNYDYYEIIILTLEPECERLKPFSNYRFAMLWIIFIAAVSSTGSSTPIRSSCWKVAELS